LRESNATDATSIRSRTHRFAVIAGHGVEPQVVEAGVLEAAARGQFALALKRLPWGSEHYRRRGAMMPANALDVLRSYDGIYLGAVGSPAVPDHLTLWGGCCYRSARRSTST
jgi:tartrate dehydrogenase/decarboxylase/D-malate dehydrogenase